MAPIARVNWPGERWPVVEEDVAAASGAVLEVRITPARHGPDHNSCLTCTEAPEEMAIIPDDFLLPKGDGFVLAHFLVVSDQERSREFYRSLFDGLVLFERDPVIMKVANSWLFLNEGGGPTDDKPTVTLETPPDPNRTSAFLNVRVAEIQKAYREWSAKGAEFLSEPKDHGREIRAYIRDPDGHLIEVGQMVMAAPPAGA